MPHWQASMSNMKGNEKSGNAKMGLERKQSLSLTKAFSHLTVHLKALPRSVRRCNGLAIAAKF